MFDVKRRACQILYIGTLLAPDAFAEQAQDKQLEDVVISASRFDTSAAIDAVRVDTLRAVSPLVNLSELLSAVPGVQARLRENYAQDLQVSIRGFGTRSTFGVRGVRILIDGIPATMPDGQGQASTVSLTSAERVEALRGPMAQLYGNAAGGVLQIFTKDPPLSSTPVIGLSAGAGSDAQRQAGISLGGGDKMLGGLFDLNHYSTDGAREHSAAKRMQINAKVIARPSDTTTVTGIFNGFHQPRAQDPLGLTHADFELDPRQIVAAARVFDTRKSVEQQQGGVMIDHQFSASDTLNMRVYGGTRTVFQALGFSGSAPASSGGIVDLDRDYGGAGMRWTHKTNIVRWVAGIDVDQLREIRRGFVNNGGIAGDLRRDEDDRTQNVNIYTQIDWTLAPRWEMTAGLRTSRVRFSVNDRFITAYSPDDSGSVTYRNTSPVLGAVWHANDEINLYANIGRGFETPTLSEIAYRADGPGPNLALRPSTSVQAEICIKVRRGHHAFDMALFDARSRDEIVPQSNNGGRSIFQNIDRVRRRGAELSWKSLGNRISAQVAYTWLDARFKSAFSNGTDNVAAGMHLPGVPMHSFFTDIETRPSPALTVGLEMRAESRTYVDDINSDAAPGYAVFNLRIGHESAIGGAKLYVFGRIDNLFDRNYAGSVIVNESNGRFFEPAAGRRLFVGIRSAL